ncbi:Pheromone-processing carboxypeptidase KEX1 [Rhodotorula toruloides]|nr:Pheromone-processing carboxypeptidase KEX1 [Rhodotorula toruloides]
MARMTAGGARYSWSARDPRTRRGFPVDTPQFERRVRDLSTRQSTPDEEMSAANFFIPSLPGQPADSSLTMYGGHIPSAPPKNGVPDTESDAHLYFFMVRNKHIADTERTLLWFNGGPGCSSFDGGMMEIGPYRLVPNGDGKLVEAEGAWNEYANVIFVDQPVGTGYSYMSTNEYVHDLPEASAHVVEFLSKFYNVFPEFKNHDTYICGESYAGQYIPYFAQAILASPRLPTRLKGLLIGNGWIDPYNQYPAYLDFALQAGVIKEGSDAEKAVRKEVKTCQEHMDVKVSGGMDKMPIHLGICERILGAITDSTIQSVNGQNMCVNNYDVRLTDTHPACGMNWPPDLHDMYPYLGRDDVKSAFHATRHPGPWVECNGQVGAQFYTPNSRPSVQLLPELLEKVPIMMFAGAEDLICNHVGIERMIENLEWNGEKGFGNATAEEWVVNGKSAGTWTSARNMTYVKITGASHMAPYDEPLATHDMFLRFIGVSLLSAAGPAAQVPSRIGNEIPAVLGSTLPNGTAIDSSSSGGLSAEKQLDGVSSGSSGDSSSLGLNSGGGKLGYGGDAALEGLVHASSALVLVALMAAAFALFLWFRRRTQRLSRGGEGGGWGALGGRPGGLSKHARAKSLGRGGGLGLGGVEHEEDDSEDVEGRPGVGGDSHELDELMSSRRAGGAGDAYRDADEKRRLAGGRRDEEEEVFGLGDDEDDEDEAAGGRKGRLD